MAGEIRFGRALPKSAEESGLAWDDVADEFIRAGMELYPGVPYQQWTFEMHRKIWARAEERWMGDS